VDGMNLLIIIISLHLVLYIVRFMIAKSYYYSQQITGTLKENGDEFSVIQPIVSGDCNLEQSLRTNVKNGGNANFIWIVDETDQEAGRIVKKIKEETGKAIKIITAKDIPNEKNEKVYKQKLALPYAREFFIAADDDVILSFDQLYKLKDKLSRQDCVITGLPYYRMGYDFFTNLVVGFVNGNTLLTYLVIAGLGAVGSLNGMFYMAKKDTFIHLNIFEKIEDKLSDEYEIAKILRNKNIQIIQSTCPCSVGTTIENFSHYMNLMRRWMVFANIYMAEKLQFSTLLTIVVPTALPLLIFIHTLIIRNFRILPIILGIQMLIAFLNYYQRRKYFKIKEPLKIILFEILSAYLQPLHYINSLIKPGMVIWRNNKVMINKDGSVSYEKVGGTSL